jgi:hypothetical protein
MSEPNQAVVVVVKPGRTPRRTIQVLKWVRWLVPAALLIVSGGVMPVADASGVITIDADSVESGPLSVADALARHHGGRTK